jgi:hypothetical protein
MEYRFTNQDIVAISHRHILQVMQATAMQANPYLYDTLPPFEFGEVRQMPNL